jgi:hypothetical protein
MAGSSANVRHLRAIGQVCQDAGLRVVEADGWENRGRTWSVLRPDYVVCHHTAASIDVDKLLIEGRSDLPGPLANLALHRDGTVVLLASGLANHVGTATISSDQAWGIEATGPIPTGNTGIDAFPNYQAYVTLVAAIRLHHGWGSGRVLSHKEIARPDGRKRDPDFGDPPPAPYTDMDRFRAEVEGRMRTWGTSEQEVDDVTKQEFLDALSEFYRDGVVAGQNTFADTYRVLVDRASKQLAEQQATNDNLVAVNARLDTLIELLSTPPEPPA